MFLFALWSNTCVYIPYDNLLASFINNCDAMSINHDDRNSLTSNEAN